MSIIKRTLDFNFIHNPFNNCQSTVFAIKYKNFNSRLSLFF